MKTKIAELFNIKYPIIQGGMIWCSGWELASAVSNAGGLGLIGAGSMSPEILRLHIKKTKNATKKPFGVNLPLIYSQIDEHIAVLLEENVKIVFTSAGNPQKYTSFLKDKGITVVHVVANVKFAQKCADAGVDAIVAEGYEAGGHNGFEENTTMTLIPQIVQTINLPVIAAGGIAFGNGLIAALALGAQGVQIGSRFAASVESSAHLNFKNAIINAKNADTMVAFKKLIPVRLIKNEFYNKVFDLERKGAALEELSDLLGRGRAKRGMFEGDLVDGELEIGQISGLINRIETAEQIIDDIMAEAKQVIEKIIRLY